MADTYLLAMRGPADRRHDSYVGFRTELENRAGDGKGKGTSGSPTRPKVPKRRPGAHCFVVAWKRGNARGAKEAGHHVVRESTGHRRNSCVGRKAAAFSGWHEPDESRGSRPESVSGSGGNSPGRLGKRLFRTTDALHEVLFVTSTGTYRPTRWRRILHYRDRSQVPRLHRNRLP